MVQNHSFYDFGPFRVDTRERVLLRDGQPVALTPKAFDTLLVLVRQSGHVVEKDQPMKAVWPETFVEEANLTQNIFALRRVLGEKVDGPKYIETVPRRGYRFVARVREFIDATAAPPESTATAHVYNRSKAATTNLLAVLPFINDSADPKMEYLSDGITESIINSLSQLPRLHVMSRNAVFRYKGKELHAQRIGKELGVDSVLVGKVNNLDGRLLISAELVDVANGWQLWGENYDRESSDILEVQNDITRQLSAALRLRLTGDEEQRLTKRYTESPEAYEAYLKARHCWSRYTREGLTQAIGYFRQAIELDPNYALAYAGAVDCYLRLATNYIPPADALPTAATPHEETDGALPEDSASAAMVKLRYEWDRKSAERELKRAIELKSTYPTAHQWYAAYLFSLELFQQTLAKPSPAGKPQPIADEGPSLTFDTELPHQSQSLDSTPGEQVQVFCNIAREQIEAGNYEAACAVLQRWWTIGEWPRLEALSPESSADLLLTAGTLTGFVASTRQAPRGQKHAEALLNGAIALFEQLGTETRAAEGRIELANCYYREGLFDVARATLRVALEELPNEDRELRSVALVRLGIVERHAGRLHDSLARMNEAAGLVELAGPWATGRYHQELATTLKVSDR